FSLLFRGCGFMHVYEAGVLKALQELSPEMLESASKIYGASSGSIVAALAVCGCDIDEMQQYLFTVGKPCFSRLLAAWRNILHILRDSLNKFLPVNAHQLASGKLHIILTRVRDLRSVVVSEFASKEDIIQAVLCSCFIPVCFGFFPPQYRGVHYIDGEFGMWKDNYTSQTTITVSAFAGEYDICPRECPVAFLALQIIGNIFQISKKNLVRIQHI
ncbi:PLPL1 protein, partial [Alectura lathami]|nr:PLPL1 protein [Alectura lathami]